MALYTTRTVLIHVPKIGVVRVTPQGGRKNAIAAPEACEITDRKGRPIIKRRKSGLTKPPGDL